MSGEPIRDAACLAVVVPVYNEAETIARVVAAVLLQSSVRQLIVVDDGSTDGTAEELRRFAEACRDPRLRFAVHSANRGKGAAVRTGFALAEAPVVAIQDADLEYDPAEYELLLAPIRSGGADAVFGTRFPGLNAPRVLYHRFFWGNRFLTLLSNLCTGLRLSDITAGSKLLRLEIVRQVAIEEEGFGIDAELVAKTARLGYRIEEVPISYRGRTYAEGKKIGWRDGVRIIGCILKYGLRLGIS